MNRIVGWYSIAVGTAMIGLWTFLYVNGSIPEIASKPWELAMHLSAEFTTAALLIASGAGVVAGSLLARRVNIFATGMLVYTLIQTPGYYLERNAVGIVLLFAGCFLLTLVLSPALKPLPRMLARPPARTAEDRR